MLVWSGGAIGYLHIADNDKHMFERMKSDTPIMRRPLPDELTDRALVLAGMCVISVCLAWL